MNSLNIKRKNIIRTGTPQNKPWQLLENQYSTMSNAVLYFGNVADGAQRFYIGYKTDASYGFFIIAGYTSSNTEGLLLIDNIYNNTWRLFKFSNTSTDR